MDDIGAQFMFTGEVLGQRPMSQRRQPMNVIDRDAELDGLLLRPLSAKHLPPTVPEENGWVDREQLGDIHGRSRQQQMELAKTYGIEDYPSPAGGCCFLTDKNFGRRILDFFKYEGKDNLTMDDVMLLKIGRHFRVSPDVKVVMGREEGENKFLGRYAPGRWKLEAKNVTGPTTLVEGMPTDEELRQIAGMTVRYAGSKADSDTPVSCHYEETEITLEPAQIDDSILDEWRI